MKKITTVFCALFLSLSASYGQVVTNTNPNGAGSLQEAVTQAYMAPAGNKTITFNIPLAANHIIGPINLNLPASGNVTSLTIDATTQPGYAGQPIVILRGNGAGNCFNVGTSNLTIKGFIVQNYQNGYNQYSGNVNIIENCWFGVDASGTSVATNIISDYGILIQGNAGNNSIAIGSQSDFTAATRNIVSGCGVGGIRFNNAGAGSYVGNTFIGTDVTGNVAIANGAKLPMETEVRHGISVNNTASLTIKNNVISANKSGGIDISGNSANSVITGNKIGTNFAGTDPLGNRNFGIRVKNSGGHTIGGLTVAERNIISANGSSDYVHEQNTANPSKFDWYNSCGIYLFNSSNNTVSGNYIGVDVSGNEYVASPAQMGNFYCGIKIDGSSSNNTVGQANAGNIIGQNGFRSSTEATLAGLQFFEGHGIIVKDATTTGTKLYGNGIGVGANGTSKVGNKQDGISIQGAAGTVVGGALAGQKNTIGDNTWGIFIASNYYNSQSTTTSILGNYIGTSADGMTAIGNGARPDHTTGGGIGIVHNTQGTIVGGTTAGLGNILSGNRLGITILGNSPIAPNGTSVTGSKIYGNLIGLGADGNTIIPNAENGIYISEKANNNDIGGISAGQGNKIAGNGQNGIYSMDATNNRISGNTIYSNKVSGIGFDITTLSTLEKNIIYGNAANGIALKGASNSNKFLGNTIGDLTVAAKANTGDGINITTSSNNVIGGVLAGEGNIIANNTGNGINISGAASINNSIHRNQISCNGLRGIELNNAANGNYAKPIFSGSETALVVTGPTGSFIELYSLDGCNNCSDPSSKKLQGRTWVASGNSPLNYAGTAGVVYTATASAGQTSAPHNTSEFSDCYTLCAPVTLTLTVSGATICSNAAVNPIVGINNAQANVKYDARLGSATGALLGTTTPTANGNITITVNRTLLVQGSNTIFFTATGQGCTSPATLTNQATVLVNKLPTLSLIVSGATICSNATTNPTVGISGAEANVTYEARLGSATGTLLGSTTPTAAGNITIVVNRTLLIQGTNTIYFTASILGCGTTTLGNQATVIVNKVPTLTLPVTGATICSNATTNPAVGIIGAEANVTYEARLGSATGILLGTTTPAGAGNISITVDRTLLSDGSNTVFFTATIQGCGTTNLSNQATVLVNKLPTLTLTVTGALTCSTSGVNPTVSINGAEPNVKYEAHLGSATGALLGSTTPTTGGNITISIDRTLLVVGDNIIFFTATIQGCGTTNLTNQATVRVDSSPKINSDVTTNSPICFGQQGTLTVVTAEKGKTYQVFDQNGIKVGDTLSLVDGPLLINLKSMAVNTYTLTVRASVPGCNGPFTLTKTAAFVVNPGLNGALNLQYKTPVCFGGADTITILASQNNVKYSAFNNSNDNPLSVEVTGNGGAIKIPLSPLPAGSNTIYFRAFIGGCGTVKLGNNATIQVDTDVNKTIKATATTPICLGGVAVVTIEGSELRKTYEIFENKVSVSAKVPGNNGTITINVPGLGEGDHKFTVNVTVPGCKNDTLLQNPFTKVNSSPDSTLKVGTNGPVCAGNQALFYILKPEPGKKYQIFKNDTAVSQVVSGIGDTLKIPLTNLAAGVHILSAEASADGCNSSTTLRDKATITINSFPKKDLIATVNGPVCVGNPAIVTVEKAETGKSYQVYYNGNAVSNSSIGNGSDLLITVNTQTIPAGIRELTIGIKVPGCTADTLTRKPLLTINSSPDSSLLVSAVTSPICVGTDGAVLISGIQANVSYQAYIGVDTASQNLSGPGPNIVLPIPASKLLVGLNSISVKAKIAGCTAKDLADTAGIKVNPNPKLDFAISIAPAVVCEGGESILTIATSEAGVTYQAVSNGKTFSTAVLSTGGEVKLTVVGLPLGDNIVSVSASAGGCLLKNLDSTVTVTVNKGAKINYGLTGSIVCKPAGGTVTISGSETGVSYEAYNKTTNTSVSGIIPGTGSSIVIPLNPSNNPVDTIIVKAIVSGCGVVRLDSHAVVVTNNPEVEKLLSTRGSTICINDASATATILNAKNNVSYEPSVGGTPLTAQTGNGGDLVFTIPKANLVEGNNIISFTANVEGCGLVPLDSSAIVVVNDNTDKGLATRGSDICVYDVNGTATVISAKNGISYQATIGNTPLNDVLVGTGADLTFTIPITTIAMGSNTVTFTASVAGCTPANLTNSAIINRNDNTTSKGLPTRGSTVCKSDLNATATIIGAKLGITYQAFKGTEAVSGTFVGKDADLEITIPTNGLSSGPNIITFIATVSGCNPVTLDSTAIVTVLGQSYDISGSTLRCFNTDGTYSIQPVPGIVSYDWTVPTGATITSGQGTNSIKVTFGTDSGFVKVSPVGSIGACNALGSELYIRVQRPFADTISILGKDTVCLNDLDRIFIDSTSIYGIDSILWTWSGGIQHVDTLSKKSLVKKFGVKYIEVGKQMITATPHLTCSDTYGVPDTLIVTVLAYPVAEAGIYPVIENDLSTPLKLDGSGSSVEGSTPHDSLKYTWSADNRTVLINNPFSLNDAYFVPRESETKVYLTITNHNRCPVKDSAVIAVITDIQIPNIFTPNGDGVHDRWEIKNLHKLFPNCTVEVFNKWGSFIYSSQGYAEAWDGSRNGDEMPVATYYYIVDFRNGSVPKRGSLTIIR